MTNTEYIEGVQTPDYIGGLLDRLLALGAKSAVLTGVSFEPDKLGVACRENNKTTYCFADKLEGNFHGTGDVFASAFSGALLNGCSLEKAAGIAVSYVCDCIRRTKAVNDDVRYGVDFERGIPFLLKELGL